MKLRLLLFFTFAISINNLIHAQEQTFKLTDGTVIVGTVKEETDLTMQVETKFGIVTINKSELILTRYEVKLKTGENLVGFITGEYTESIILKTRIGELTIQRSDIINIQEESQQKPTSAGNTQEQYRRPYGLTDFLFSGSKIDKDTDFALGEEQLIDLFFDATGYTLKQSTLYLSGLSFGFGITNKFQITTKWGSFFYGNLNLRPKFQVFEKGNWENQHSLSVGAHYHTRWRPNKYEWKSGSIVATEYTGSYNEEILDPDYGKWLQTAPAKDTTKYWGGYYQIGANPSFPDPTYTYPDDDYNPNATNTYYDSKPWVNYNDEEESEENFIEMIELFGAYTYSKARPGLRGRISHTWGGNVQYFSLDDEPTLLYRAYYGLDVDINSKLKMIGELFYDSYFLELWQQFENENYYNDSDDFSDTPLNKPDDYRPVHLDFGFMYALNETFRFGIHFQRPFIAFYWKF